MDWGGVKGSFRVGVGEERVWLCRWNVGAEEGRVKEVGRVNLDEVLRKE